MSQGDLSGGTFTISNAGMLGVEYFTPIINYPQTAIMGVGAVLRLPRYLDDCLGYRRIPLYHEALPDL